MWFPLDVCSVLLLVPLVDSVRPENAPLGHLHRSAAVDALGPEAVDSAEPHRSGQTSVTIYGIARSRAGMTAWQYMQHIAVLRSAEPHSRTTRMDKHSAPPFISKRGWAYVPQHQQERLSADYESLLVMLGAFIGLSLMLRSLPIVPLWQSLALMVWLVAAAGVYAYTRGRHSKEESEGWLEGYLLELIFSMENILIYELIASACNTPPTAVKKALFLVICCQVVFQFILYMDIATWLESLNWLPYVLGVWLLYVGFAAWNHDDHGESDMQEAPSVRLLKRVLGDRLLLDFDGDSFFTISKGKTAMTMLGPVFLSLLMVDLLMEVDVSLTKIETNEHHVINFTSSTAAAFAVPEFYVIVSMLMVRCPQLKSIICIAVIFFGMELLLIDLVTVNEIFALAVLSAMMVAVVAYSELARMGLLGSTQEPKSLDIESDCDEGKPTAGKPAEVRGDSRTKMEVA